MSVTPLPPPPQPATPKVYHRLQFDTTYSTCHGGKKSGSTQYRIQRAGNTPEGLPVTSTRNHRLYLPRWESVAAHSYNVLNVPVTHIYRSTNDFSEKRGTLPVTAGKSGAHNYYTVRMQCTGFTHMKVYQRRP